MLSISQLHSFCVQWEAVSYTHLDVYKRQSTLPAILKDYPRKDIFNPDETGLFFHCMPDKTLSFKGEQCSCLLYTSKKKTSLLNGKGGVDGSVTICT